MRICIVTHAFVETDGQGRVNLELARHLAARGHSLVLVASSFAEELARTPRVECIGARAPRWLPSTLLRYAWFALAARRRLRRLDRFDILHLNGAITFGRCDVNTAHFVHGDWRRSPYHPARIGRGPMAWYHRLFTAAHARFERRAFRGSGRVAAVSPGIRDALIREVGIDSTTITVIPPGVDASAFRPAATGDRDPLRTSIDATADAFVLVFVGDAKSPRKNLDVALRALRQLPDRTVLAVIGDYVGGPYLTRADELGVRQRVHFLGPRNDVPSLLRFADCVVFPSHHDPFGLVVAEAMASGVPVIASRAAGSSSLIDDELTGFILDDATDEVALAARVEQLMKCRTFRASMGKAARDAVLKHGWATMANAYERLYRTLADAGEPGGKQPW